MYCLSHKVELEGRGLGSRRRLKSKCYYLVSGEGWREMSSGRIRNCVLCDVVNFSEESINVEFKTNY